MADLRVLGPVQLWVAGRQLDLGPTKQRTVLVALVINAGYAVTTETLIDRIWDEDPPAGARSGLYSYITKLRRVLAAAAAADHAVLRLVNRPDGYLVEIDPDAVDLHRFHRLVAQAEQLPDDAARLTALEKAIALYRGEPLADLSGGWVQETRQTIAREYLEAVLRWAEVSLRLGRPGPVVGRLQRLLIAHPLVEPLMANLIEALYRAGRRAEALDCYAQSRQRLVDRLGAEPGPRLRELHRTILRDEPAQVAAGAAPARYQPAQLPPDLDGFTGRVEQLARLDALLPPPGATRTGTAVVTITGSAGVGKTALGVHWAHRVRDRFPDGQLHVNLNGYAPRPPVQPVEALAQLLPALGVPTDQIPSDLEPASAIYRSVLADKRMLVLLDNARTADQVRPLLPASAGCLVLVTSRDRLGGLVARDGAHRVTLDVLTADEAQGLLTRMVGSARTTAEPAATADLATACACLPLALRIAAAHLTDHPQQRIADHVAALRTGDRLAGLRIDDDEQTAVRAAFDLSYAALTPPAQRMYRLLGLVPGPDISVAAAAELADIRLPMAGQLLDRLAAAHLIAEHAPARYTFHDLLRAYAMEHADRDHDEPGRTAARGRLYRYYLETVDTAMDLLRPRTFRLPDEHGDGAGHRVALDTPEQALAWMRAEWPDLVAAVTAAADTGPRPMAWRLVDSLRTYCAFGVARLDRLTIAEAGRQAAQAEGNLPGEAVAELVLGTAELDDSRYPAAIAHYTRALTLAGEAGWDACEAFALNGVGNVHARLGHLPDAEGHYRRALHIRERLGNKPGQAATLDNLGLINYSMGRLAAAAELCGRAAAILEQLGMAFECGLALANLGLVLHALGRLGDAREQLNRSVHLCRADPATAESMRMLALVEQDAGNPHAALELAETALALATRSAARRFEPCVRNSLGTVLRRQGRPDEAIDQHDHARNLARKAGDRRAEIEAIIGLADACAALGRTEQARDHARSALTLAQQAGYRLLEGHAATALAGVELAAGRPDEAVTTGLAALRIHGATGHRLGQAHTHRLLGNGLDLLGRPADAVRQWQAALARYATLGAPEADEVRDLLAGATGALAG